MKRCLLITIVALGLAAVPMAHAESGVTLVLQGGPEPDFFSVELSADGRTYEIDSNAALDVGAGICWHPEGTASRLTCEAPPISGFELNGGEGTDTLTLGHKVSVPATMRGGPGDDVLSGGRGADKLMGCGGNDELVGSAGDDLLIGGYGNDTLFGRQGKDRLLGGPGNDRLWGGTGADMLVGGPGNDLENPGTGPVVTGL